jgi:UDP-N-acetylglucosamine 4-epimerase
MLERGRIAETNRNVYQAQRPAERAAAGLGDTAALRSIFVIRTAPSSLMVAQNMSSSIMGSLDSGDSEVQMTGYEQIKKVLSSRPKNWAITGVAGFIGSHLLERLLLLDQKVVGLDNFETGHAENLDEVRASVGEERWTNFQLLEGDVREPASCAQVCEGADFVLHQAALGSVPRSIAKPGLVHENNVTGFVNMLLAARDAGPKRFVFASSSAVYGDSPELPRVEEKIGRQLSPYAATKAINESYADLFARVYGMPYVGLRYFNVFGPRQDPAGPYAAVIPKWTSALLRDETIWINGDGETSRDFCFVQDVVQANLLAATTTNPEATGHCYNIAAGERTTLNQLFAILRSSVEAAGATVASRDPAYQPFRAGDIRHSLADISKARRLLGYEPQYTLRQGLEQTLDWYGRLTAALRPSCEPGLPELRANGGSAHVAKRPSATKAPSFGVT